MRTIRIGKHPVKLPETWDELTPRQMETLAQIATRQYNLYTACVYFVLNIIEMRILDQLDEDVFRFVWHFRRGVITTEELSVLAQQVRFVFSHRETEDTWFIDSKLVTEPYSALTIGIHRFYGPGDALTSITYEQFMYAQHYLQRLQSGEECLCQLLACLWHSRKVFDPERIDHDAKHLSTLPYPKQNVMFWYWTGCMDYLIHTYPRIFSGKGGEAVNVYEEQLRIVDALAQGDMTKKPLVRSGNLYDAIYSMDEAIRKNEELEHSLK